jgi:predicted AAA+ superfamily ATPase
MITKDTSIYKRLNDLISANKNIKVLFVAPRRSGKTTDSFNILKEYANKFTGNYLFVVHTKKHKKFLPLILELESNILELNNKSKIYILTIREAHKFRDTIRGVIIDEPDILDRNLLDNFIEKVIPMLNSNANSLFILIGSFFSTITDINYFLYNSLKAENDYIYGFLGI